MIAGKDLRSIALLAALGAAVAACGERDATQAGAQPGEPLAQSGAADAADARGEAADSTRDEDRSAPLVVFLGDSLTAGYGLPADSGYPAVIERTLRDEGHPIRMVNAGVSGDTSAGGRSRLPWLLEQQPDVLVVALGGNDGLRGLAPSGTRENLRAIVSAAQAQGVSVLLLGLKMPPNYGPEYTAEFEQLYAEVAQELKVPLVPFMLEGVAGDPSLNQGDGLHPTAEGQVAVAGNVLPALRELLEAAR